VTKATVQETTTTVQTTTVETAAVENVVITHKKRRTDEAGASVITQSSTTTTTTAVASSGKEGKGGKEARKTNTPFQRIKADDVVYADERLKNNRFEAKGGVDGDYGEKANADLIVTRGAGFRKEKNKKKRGSYRGGEITMQSHSIKFA